MEFVHSLGAQFVLNDRWLFVTGNCQLVDLEVKSVPITLKPVCSRILGLLVRSPQTVIRRRQLLDEGWRSFGFEVCENSLNQAICTLRITFDALQPGQCNIKTIPRIGYCLLMDVRPATAEDSRRSCLPPPPQGYAGDFRTNASAAEPVLFLDRPTFNSVVEREWRDARGSNRQLSLLTIEVDGIDAFLGQASLATDSDAFQVIDRCIVQHLYRLGDAAGRYDDRTIAVVLPNTDSAGAAVVAERIQRVVQALDRRQLPDSSPRVTVAVGAVSVSLALKSANALMEASIAALCEAKTRDDRRWCGASPGISTAAGAGVAAGNNGGSCLTLTSMT